jgi:hypothetical protein
MCLTLYIGTREVLPERETADLAVEPVGAGQQAVVQWFTQPSVQFVGAHTGCSCGFPSVVAEDLVEYYDGMLAGRSDRANDLRSVSALLQLVGAALEVGQPVELYPVWEGDESKAPKGVVQWSFSQLNPERMVFNQQFLYEVRR